MKIVAIIQARMASNRLPGKVMADVCGKPMLHYVLARVQLAFTLSLLVVATTDQTIDDVIEIFCKNRSVPCFRGSQEDVLDRYYRAAKHFQADVIVRLTADCPLLDPKVIDKVVETFTGGGFDYVSNTRDPTYPNGLDAEVFSWSALERAWQEARLRSEREHVSPFIYKNPKLFRIGNVKNAKDLSSLRWTVDEPEDLQFVRELYRNLQGNENCGFEDVLAVLRAHPELNTINAGIARNEGYEISLKRDSVSITKGTT